MDLDNINNPSQTAAGETHGETANGNADPNNAGDNLNAGLDKSNDPPVNDPTSNDDGNNDGAAENFLGTYKTREDAENGFKSAQAKITEQGNRIKELEAQINKSEAPQLPNIQKEVAKVQEKIGLEYQERLKGLGVKYSSYLPDDVQVNTIDDIVANLPSTAASRFTAEFKDIQAEYNEKIKQGVNGVYKDANTKFEELKAKDKERYKDNELIFDIWYGKPPQTIDEVAQLVADVKKQAIEEYIKEQAAKAEDDQHKNRMANGGSSNKAKYGEDHIFTRQELREMSDKTFAKYEAVISQQVAKGLVK